jgi:hypothetical protein
MWDVHLLKSQMEMQRRKLMGVHVSQNQPPVTTTSTPWVGIVPVVDRVGGTSIRICITIGWMVVVVPSTLPTAMQCPDRHRQRQAQ